MKFSKACKNDLCLKDLMQFDSKSFNYYCVIKIVAWQTNFWIDNMEAKSESMEVMEDFSTKEKVLSNYEEY